MAVPIHNTFSSWKLTADEVLSGSVLSELQIQVLQNQISEIAEQKLGLQFDPKDTADFGIQTAYLQGQLDILNLRIAISEEATRVALDNAVTAAQSQ